MVSSEVPTDCSPNHESSESSRVLSLGTTVVITPPFNNNGNSDTEKVTGELGKQPSYVSLARCISGYTTLTTYNSKQREGFRSRDISPARITGIYQDLSPSRGEDGILTSLQGSNYLTAQPQYLTDMELRSDFGGEKVWNGNNKFNSNNNSISSSTSISKQSNGCTRKITFTNSSTMSASDSHYSNETHSFSTNAVSSLSRNFQEMKLTSETASGSTLNTSPVQRSFIVQRVERLYGPGALAQGFYTRHKTRYSPPSQENKHEENNRCDTEESLPVLRHLRPEFRAQLSLAKRKLSSPSLTPQRIDESNGEIKERIIPIEIEVNQPNADLAMGERETANISDEKDGHYYLQLVCKDVETLQRLATDIESELETLNTIPEEFAGRLRAAAGKARLLATQKLAQFQGLCKKNINQDMSEDFPTTCEDLAGFWDMVSIQISSVYEEFEKINKLKASGWKKETLFEDKPSPKAVQNGVTSARRSKGNGSKGNTPVSRNSSGKSPSSASKARDEERKRLIEERRKEMRKSLNSHSNEDTVFVSAE